ncbi:MAG: hypothetical protein F4Y39_24770 [Gemmatimonadetes bacterium]|nr:hypothetical protein [Gemmatimonadota bacterium]MYF79162.1 hypothetical protein [Chloroflexota bacterium]
MSSRERERILEALQARGTEVPEGASDSDILDLLADAPADEASAYKRGGIAALVEALGRPARALRRELQDLINNEPEPEPVDVFQVWSETEGEHSDKLNAVLDAQGETISDLAAPDSWNFYPADGVDPDALVIVYADGRKVRHERG